MLSTSVFLVLASATQLYAQISPDKCLTSKTGDVSGSGSPLQRVVLDKPIQEWLISIPKCTTGAAAGVLAAVCDYDKVPSVTFIDTENLKVVRNGQLQYPATVDVVLYCNSRLPSNVVLVPEVLG